MCVCVCVCLCVCVLVCVCVCMCVRLCLLRLYSSSQSLISNCGADDQGLYESMQNVNVPSSEPADKPIAEAEEDQGLYEAMQGVNVPSASSLAASSSSAAAAAAAAETGDSTEELYESMTDANVPGLDFKSNTYESMADANVPDVEFGSMYEDMSTAKAAVKTLSNADTVYDDMARPHEGLYENMDAKKKTAPAVNDDPADSVYESMQGVNIPTDVDKNNDSAEGAENGDDAPPPLPSAPKPLPPKPRRDPTPSQLYDPVRE